MNLSSDDHDPKIAQPEIFFPGLRIVLNIIRRLIHLVIPTEQELIEAGVYLGNTHI